MASGHLNSIRIAACPIMALVAFAAGRQQPESEGPTVPQDLILLGTADNVTFFAEPVSNRAYAAANTYCVNAGFTLAAIKTKAQADVIVNALVEKGHINLNFWTSLRESRALSNYVWPPDNTTTVDGSFFTDGVVDTMDPEVAVIGGRLHVNVVNGATQSIMYMGLATANGKVLCQMG